MIESPLTVAGLTTASPLTAMVMERPTTGSYSYDFKALYSRSKKKHGDH
jgi:hypothetical protein